MASNPAVFLSPITKEKGRRRREKSNACALSFYNGYFEIVFGQKKKLLDAKGPFGDHVFKNPATCILNKISSLALLSRAFSCFQRP